MSEKPEGWFSVVDEFIINLDAFTKEEYYSLLCSVNDALEEEQYGPETKLNEIRKVLDWAFSKIEG